MPDVSSKYVQLLEKEIAQYRQMIQTLERMVSAFRSSQVGARPAVAAAKPAPSRKPAAKPTAKATKAKPAPKPKSVAAVATKGRTRPSAAQRTGPSYVDMAIEILQKAGKPMRMAEIVNTVLAKRPEAGKYAPSAARQAITAAAEKPGSRIIRVGEKGSGLYSLRD